MQRPSAAPPSDIQLADALGCESVQRPSGSHTQQSTPVSANVLAGSRALPHPKDGRSMTGVRTCATRESHQVARNGSLHRLWVRSMARDIKLYFSDVFEVDPGRLAEIRQEFVLPTGGEAQ